MTAQQKRLTVFHKATRDSPIWRIPLDQLPTAELEAFVQRVRTIRESAAHKYQELVRARSKARTSKLVEKAVDQLKMFQKELGQLDKIIEKIDKRVTLVAAIRLEMQDLEIGSYQSWEDELGMDESSISNSSTGDESVESQ